ncbi:MAG: 50S ribosomal protein L31 [Anaerolineales bacterium]|nr:50S ribosomal protein L31 [Anaerolineales bacterium]
MKNEIHPTYYEEATVTCACGNSWTTGSTQESISTDVCSKCHPFFTGEQRIVDTEGQVDRFYRKLAAREEHKVEASKREGAKTSLSLDLEELELGKRSTDILKKAGIITTGDVLERLEKGSQELLDLSGFGQKSLSDLKRIMRQRGYEIPEVD